MFRNRLPKNELKKRVFSRKEDYRGHYFRDTTAIIHSLPFRRLKHKTQVFFSPKNDHICTRIEHELHVASISATISKALDLNADLAWAISLGHDLGHSPFGHVGEMIISNLFKDIYDFKHEIYSLRVVDHIINYGKGLNLTYAVRDGIINHCGEKFEQYIEPDQKIKDLNKITDRTHFPATYEGAIVRMSDKIAYLGRDLEDALKMEIIKESDIPVSIKKNIGIQNSQIINFFVSDLIKTSKKVNKIGFSDSAYELLIEFKNFNYKYIYLSKKLIEYHIYFERILKLLYDYLNEILGKYGSNYENYKKENNFIAFRFSDYLKKMEVFYKSNNEKIEMSVLDYIAGMTDDYAIECAKELILPEKFNFEFNKIFFE